MKLPDQRTIALVSKLTAGILYGSALLRWLLNYGSEPAAGQVLGLLLAWLFLFLSLPAVLQKWKGYFPIYLILQAGLVFGMLALPEQTGSDYFAVLLAVLSMQVMQHFEARRGALWVVLLLLPMAALFLVQNEFSRGLSLTLLYTAVSLLVASYSLAARRAQEAGRRNQALADDLQAANRQLEATSAQLERLATARERSRLRRELHDSVTQTVFSMNLTAQSAALLLNKDPGRVEAQLERLGLLAQSALAELKLLAPEIPAAGQAETGLVEAIRRHIAGPGVSPGLQVALEVEGSDRLDAAEAHGLYRIAQEALNNIVKHAGTGQATIRLHLEPPYWMQVEDGGRGFDPSAAPRGGVGLAGMRERASEIGWELQVSSAPGEGTRVRVCKPQASGAPVSMGRALTGEEQKND
jgi:signal transduction histidine kinase